MEKLDIILKALDDKIAENVVSIDLKGKSSIAEYFVIATGSAVNHNQAICDEIEFQLKKNNMDCLSTEGYKDGNWILLDCGENCSSYYDKRL